MSANLFDNLIEYSKNNYYPFHMPGHKRNCLWNLKNNIDIFDLDITEIENFDNLHKPEGIIKDAQLKSALTFGSKESFFLVNGSSCGLISSILATAFNEKIIISRNCHKSVFDGLVLAGSEPVYIMPSKLENLNIFGNINIEALKETCENNKDAKAVLIVSPTVEGIVSNIKKISEIVHSYNMVLIVDEAHGAHFNFNNYFPTSSVHLGADIVIQSLHKTLPSPTQSSILHLCSNRVNRDMLKNALTMTQTTSPSYVFMALIDRLRDYLDNEGKNHFKTYVENLKTFRKNLNTLNNFYILDEKIKTSAFNIDLSKVIIFSKNVNCIDVSNILREEYKIELEMATPNYMVLITTVGDKKEGFYLFEKAIAEIDCKITSNNKTLAIKYSTLNCNEVNYVYPLPITKILPRNSILKKVEHIDLKNAIGRISGEFIIPYPPGIPLISPGELITEELIKTINIYKSYEINIVGAKNSTLEKIAVLM